jgi:hypothetical protein
MTAFCDWLAVIFFFVAFILALVVPADAGRWTWPVFVAAGLLAWAVPMALTASHIAHS